MDASTENKFELLYLGNKLKIVTELYRNILLPKGNELVVSSSGAIPVVRTGNKTSQPPIKPANTPYL
ncbi:hypothetical protein Hanom_Chr01g00093511 [Helianthus anomalus]